MLSNLAAWIRQHRWLRAAYKLVPTPIRRRVAVMLDVSLSRQVRFRRNKNWANRSVVRNEEAATVPPSVRFDNAAGANVFAYIRGQFGIAEGARSYARALLSAGYPVAIHDIAIDVPHNMGDTSFDEKIARDFDPSHAVNLVFVGPDYFSQALENIGRDRLAGRYTIACWYWELENFPTPWLPALEEVDEIMVSSDFVRQSMQRVTDKPILLVPLPVSEAPSSGLQRADFGLAEDAFLFLTSFDFNSYVARKNPIAVIEAFRRAFPEDRSDVQLLVKSSNGHRHPEKLRALLNAARSSPRVVIRDDVLDRADMLALLRCADAYVSLHRAEGFGLGLAECMGLGKPVIATAWSGNLEFMTAENSCLVDYHLVPVNEGEYVHHEGQRWAEPDVAHAAAHMRRLANDRVFATEIGARAAHDIRERLAPAVVARMIIDRLEALPKLASADAGAVTISKPGVHQECLRDE